MLLSQRLSGCIVQYSRVGARRRNQIELDWLDWVGLRWVGGWRTALQGKKTPSPIKVSPGIALCTIGEPHLLHNITDLIYI